MTPQDEDCNNQRILLNTTVPQAIVSQNLGSRHEPTRRSLKHSRKFSRHKNDPDDEEDVVVDVSLSSISTAVAQFTTGIGLNVVFVWQHFSIPSLAVEHVEYATGLTVCFSGVVALSSKVFRRRCFRQRPFTLFTLTTLLISVVICLYAAASHSYSLYRLYFAIPGCQDVSTRCECRHETRIAFDGLTCDQVKTSIPLLWTLTTSLEFAAILFAGAFALLELQRCNTVEDDRTRPRRNDAGDVEDVPLNAL